LRRRWNFGTLGLWDFGILGLWNFGSLGTVNCVWGLCAGLWNFEFWNFGTSNFGTLELWNFGTLKFEVWFWVLELWNCELSLGVWEFVTLELCDFMFSVLNIIPANFVSA